MFARRPDPPARTVAILVDDQPVTAREGDSVAAALLAAGFAAFRTTPVTGAPRGPYCMIGVCFDCLVAIDGEPNRQACMTLVRDGMRVERQHGARRVEP